GEKALQHGRPTGAAVGALVHARSDAIDIGIRSGVERARQSRVDGDRYRAGAEDAGFGRGPRVAAVDALEELAKPCGRSGDVESTRRGGIDRDGDDERGAQTAIDRGPRCSTVAGPEHATP